MTCDLIVYIGLHIPECLVGVGRPRIFILKVVQYGYVAGVF